MKESCWVKTLKDGDTEFGSDVYIERGEASWTRGRQDIISTSLDYVGKRVELRCSSVEGTCAEWKQEDRMIFGASVGKSYRIRREVSCTTLGYPKATIRTRGNTTTLTLGTDGPLDISKSGCVSCAIRHDGSIVVKYGAKEE